MMRTRAHVGPMSMDVCFDQMSECPLASIPSN